MTHRKPYDAPRIVQTVKCNPVDAHGLRDGGGVWISTYPMCESPLCIAEATTDRRGVLLCERHAAFIDRCFPG